MRILKTTVFALVLGLTGACQNTGSNSDASDADKETIQLKGVKLLASSLIQTLGNKKDIDIQSDDDMSLLEMYKKNFGGLEGLSVGKTFTDTASDDNQMTGYFLSLGHVAANAAAQCALMNDVECVCDSPGAARMMLEHAVSFIDFTLEENASVVTDFSDLCSDNPNEAITALLASIAFAKRN